MANLNSRFKENFGILTRIINSQNFSFSKLLQYLEKVEPKTEEHPSKKNDPVPYSTPKPNRELTLVITEKCNLKCAYCLRNSQPNDKKEIPFPVLKKIILSAHRFGIKSFSITGGEPLIYSHWQELIKLIGTLKSSVFIETNGSLLEEEDIIFLENTLENRINKILISLGGYESATHNEFRGQGTFVKAVKAIKLLHKHNISIETNILLSPLNLMSEEDILKYIKFNKDLGVSEVIFGGMVGLGRAQDSKFLLSENQYIQINKIFAKHNYFMDEKDIKVRSESFQKALDVQPCQRLGQEISVSPNGLHPCIFHTYTLKIGDFKDFEALLYSDFLSSLYSAGVAMQKYSKKEEFFSCGKCIKYLPQWLSLIKKKTFIYSGQEYEKN